MSNYLPVVRNGTFHLLLLAMIFFGLTGKIADVETEFLYGASKKEIFKEYWPGMVGVGPDVC